jgi:hypothetical protein
MKNHSYRTAAEKDGGLWLLDKLSHIVPAKPPLQHINRETTMSGHEC